MKHSTSFRLASAGILVLLASLLFTVNAFAAVDAFIVFKNVASGTTFKGRVNPATGDCLIKGVPPGTYTATLVGSPEYFTVTNTGGVPSGTIAISSFSWGVSNSASMANGTGLGAGKASFSDLSISKTTDQASPGLIRTAGTATPAPTSGGFTHQTLTCRKAGSEQKDYYMVTLQNVVIGNWSSSSGEDNPSESMSKVKGEKGAVYDIKANVKI